MFCKCFFWQFLLLGEDEIKLGTLDILLTTWPTSPLHVFGSIKNTSKWPIQDYYYSFGLWLRVRMFLFLVIEKSAVICPWEKRTSLGTFWKKRRKSFCVWFLLTPYKTLITKVLHALTFQTSYLVNWLTRPTGTLVCCGCGLRHCNREIFIHKWGIIWCFRLWRNQF